MLYCQCSRRLREAWHSYVCVCAGGGGLGGSSNVPTARIYGIWEGLAVDVQKEWTNRKWYLMILFFFWHVKRKQEIEEDEWPDEARIQM